ncbi:MAG: respiratory chain complex I subunit 1 family protein [Thermoplasmatota archaeon]
MTFGAGDAWADATSAFAQVLFVLILAPLTVTVAQRTKAFWQNRRGPPWLQGYYDAAKLLRKAIVASRFSGPVGWMVPAATLVVYLVATLLLPLVSPIAPFGFAGDLLAFVYLLALARFLLALSGLDAGGAFGGLGSSRELTFGALIEPGAVISLVAFAYVAGTTSFDGMSGAIVAIQWTALPPALLLALAAFLILVVAELNRIPVDNPATHLELTMVHEAMLLEQSGPNLAAAEYANAVKHVALLGLVAAVLVPWSGGSLPFSQIVMPLATAVKVLFLMVVVATAESWVAKWRVFRVPELTTIAFVLAFLALLGILFTGGA